MISKQQRLIIKCECAPTMKDMAKLRPEGHMRLTKLFDLAG